MCRQVRIIIIIITIQVKQKAVKHNYNKKNILLGEGNNLYDKQERKENFEVLLPCESEN